MPSDYCGDMLQKAAARASTYRREPIFEYEWNDR
jgi:hypothetical protein